MKAAQPVLDGLLERLRGGQSKLELAAGLSDRDAVPIDLDPLGQLELDRDRVFGLAGERTTNDVTAVPFIASRSSG